MMSTLGGCVGLEDADFRPFYFERVVVVLKDMLFHNVSFRGCGGPVRTDFGQFGL